MAPPAPTQVPTDKGVTNEHEHKANPNHSAQGQTLTSDFASHSGPALTTHNGYPAQGHTLTGNYAPHHGPAPVPQNINPASGHTLTGNHAPHHGPALATHNGNPAYATYAHPQVIRRITMPAQSRPMASLHQLRLPQWDQPIPIRFHPDGPVVALPPHMIPSHIGQTPTSLEDLLFQLGRAYQLVWYFNEDNIRMHEHIRMLHRQKLPDLESSLGAAESQVRNLQHHLRFVDDEAFKIQSRLANRVHALEAWKAQVERGEITVRDVTGGAVAVSDLATGVENVNLGTSGNGTGHNGVSGSAKDVETEGSPTPKAEQTGDVRLPKSG